MGRLDPLPNCLAKDLHLGWGGDANADLVPLNVQNREDEVALRHAKLFTGLTGDHEHGILLGEKATVVRGVLCRSLCGCRPSPRVIAKR